jgi:hypothetical protein
MKLSSRIFANVGFALLFSLSLLASACDSAGSRNSRDSGIDVVCGQDLGLTEESGFVVDWADKRQVWKAVLDEDLLVLTRRGMCGDECSFEDEIVLSGVSKECPELVSASVTTTDQGGAGGPAAATEAAQNGTLKIQDWNSAAGTFSGHLESEVVLTFFVTISQE